MKYGRILTFDVRQCLLEHDLCLAEGGGGLLDELYNGGRQGCLGIAVELLDDFLLGMANTDGGEEAVGGKLILMHLGDTRLRLGDVDQKVLGLIEEGMEGHPHR